MSRNLSQTLRRAALLFISCAAVVGAQEFRATMIGLVTDSSGAVVAGAKVTVTNLDTSVKSATEANNEGNYVVPFLAPGNYRLRVEHPGFKSFERGPIELRVNDRVRVDVKLDVGEVSEQVTVRAEAPLLQTDSASAGQVIDSIKVASLPLFGRNTFMLSAVATGVQYTFTRSSSAARPYDNAESSVIINGSRGATNQFLLDGVPNTATESSNAADAAFVPSPDATAEFMVQTNTYDAQYGRTGGGTISIALKSGTNRLHGALYNYWRNDALYATRFDTKLVGGHKEMVRWNEPGIELDGPVYLPKLYDGRNRTFFMYSWEAIRNTSPAVRTWTLPIVSERSGDFSKTLQSNGQPVVVYDPLTTQQSGSTFTRQPFADNRIPQSRMNPISLKVLPYIPEPNLPGRFSNLIASPNTYRDIYDQHVIRIDHTLTSRQKFFSRYVRNNRHEVDSASGYPKESTVDGYLHWRINQGGNFDLTSTFSPSLVLNSRVGFIRHQFAIQRYTDGFDPATLGFPANLVNQLPRKTFPQFSFSDYTGVSQGGSIFNFSDTWSWSETLNKTTGGHSFKLGGEFRVMFNNQTNPTSTAGSFSFDKGYTQRDPLRGDAGSGNAFALFLLGFPSGGSVPYNIQKALGNRYYVLFFQDDWRISRRLTLNLGLRWDYESPQSERFDRQNRGFDKTADSPFKVPGMQLKGGLLFTDSQHRLPYKRDLNNFQPRFGFAYQARSRMVIRGGYGLSYLPSFDTGRSQGFSVNTSFVSSLDGGITPYGTLTNPYPNGILLPPGRSQGLATLLGNGFDFAYFNREVPHVHQFSFGVQQELPWRMLVDASYVGSRTIDVQTTRSINEISAEQLRLGTDLLTLLPNPFAGLLPGTSLNAATITRQQLLRPFPQFTGLSEANRNGGRAWYNSFQLRVEKRLSRGLNFLVSYTLSKSLEAVGYLNAQDPIDSFARVLTSIDQPHRFVISGTYEPPFFANTPGIVRAILYGWQLNTMVTFQSGTPIGAPGSAVATGINPSLAEQHRSRWFNTCTVNTSGKRQNCASDAEPVAWLVQPPYTLRTLSSRFPNIRTIRPPLADVSLFKAFRLREGLNLQFRGESYNTTNTPWFGGPDTSINSANFGVVSGSQINDARAIQLSVKLLF